MCFILQELSGNTTWRVDIWLREKDKQKKRNREKLEEKGA
jgi:hypothetical protein